MIRPGLVSVTFRQLPTREIVRLAAAGGLEGIEWGGDVHVPDVATAREVRRMTEDAGLVVAAYGSYWRAGDEGMPVQGDFGDVVETAVMLGAPTVRVWAGAVGSQAADRRRVADALRIACVQAAEAGLTVSLEYHRGTLTDTLDSTLRLVRAVDHPALRLYWQPVPERSCDERRAEVRAILPLLSNLHVFQWTRVDGQTLRHPLTEGEAEWPEIFRIADGSVRSLSPLGERGRGEGSTIGRFALLEFVPDDDPVVLAAEAATLRRWLS